MIIHLHTFTHRFSAPPRSSANLVAFSKHFLPPPSQKNSSTIFSISGNESSPSKSKSYMSNVKFDRVSILNVHTFQTETINSKKSTSLPPVVSKYVKHLSVQGVQSKSKKSKNSSSLIAPSRDLLIRQNRRQNFSIVSRFQPNAENVTSQFLFVGLYGGI